MIKINLLSKRKVKRVDKGQQEVMLGFIAIAAAAAAVFFFVHSPMQNDIAKLQKTNKKLKRKNKQKKNELKDYKSLQAAVKNLQTRKAAIEVRKIPGYDKIDHKAIGRWRAAAQLTSPSSRPCSTRSYTRVFRQ